MSREQLTWDELHALNHFERDVTAYAQEIRNVGFDDAPEALGKLDALVALAGEHRARILRRARLDAERMADHPRECVPPVEVC